VSENIESSLTFCFHYRPYNITSSQNNTWDLVPQPCDGGFQLVVVDCDETSNAMVKLATICMVLTKLWLIHQWDVQNIFLHGDLHETMYMHQPFGFRDHLHPDHICRLRKSLFGLKQSPCA